MSTPNTHYGFDKIDKIMKACSNKTVFFLGAGGIMMSSMALITKQRGYKVSGSDMTRTALTEKLEEAGIEIFYTHDEKNLGDDCGLVVYTVAVSESNPEYSYAIANGIDCISRADYLGYIMMGYDNRIGIAGMHGKSTCTSMCAEIFMDHAKRKEIDMPTVISGAQYAPMNGAYLLGGTEDFIFEACEYMDSFLDFNPTIAILLNAEMEHVDYFKSIEQIRESFFQYAMLTGDNGTVVANIDDENIMQAIENYTGRVVCFGFDEEADFRAVNVICENGRTVFDILRNGEHFIHISLPSSGIHNVYNALAATAAAYISGIPGVDIANGLENFKGAIRRMEFKGKYLGADIYDDYGHHPTEILATLDGVKQMVGDHRRIVCAFQPHTYSRTYSLADRFSEAFRSADIVLLVDIYAARETNECGMTSKKLAEIVGDKAKYVGDINELAQTMSKELLPDDYVVVMGAGDIYKVYKAIGL